MMNDRIKEFLSEYGKLLKNTKTYTQFWDQAIMNLRYIDFQGLISVCKKLNLEIFDGQSNLDIRHYVHQRINSPFMDAAEYASYFTSGPYKCAQHYDQVVNACLVGDMYRVYETVNKETGEIDFLIISKSYPIDKYIIKNNKEIFDQTGAQDFLNRSDFKELVKAI